MTDSKKLRSAWMVVGLAICLTGAASATELDGPVSIVFDSYRVPTIVAQTEHDAIYMQGYMHARDRLFQMDFQRRLFQGKVSELTGPAGIPTDVQLRTLGLRRAAERSLAVQTPEVIAWLEAYSAGVNAFLADTSQPLPLEYFLLETDRDGIPLWTPTDSLTMAKGLAFDLSFDLSDIDRTLALLTFRGVCDLIGCNGLQLAQADVYRTAPFEPASSIPPSPPPPSTPPPGEPPEDEELPSYYDDPGFGEMVQSYRDQIVEVPLLKKALESDPDNAGSNWWVVSGNHTDSGYPMIANDPHLSLGTPATFYQVHLSVAGGINLTGSSFPGAPGLVLGCNETICWGATVNAIDVTDVYQEVLLALGPDPAQPTHTLFNGVPEPLQFIPQTFLFNIIGDAVPNNKADAMVPAASGGVTLIVPRRNDGPIVEVLPGSPTTGLSVQYVGWSPTQELETFRRFARATSMQDFKDALQYFDVGSQNWSYADVNGNIAYYTSGELPIREDLQTLFFPAGLITPGLIRDGTHTNPHEWMTLANPQPNQSLPQEILPFNEMPQIENPSAGYILNANNDPIGTTFGNVSWTTFRQGFNGRLYLSSGYATGYRQGRLQRLFDDLLGGGGTLSTAESIAVQANNQLLDAEILTPYLFDAYANATDVGAAPELTAIVADTRVGEAIGRIAAWDFSTPTGINLGWDPGDFPGVPGPPAAGEAEASVAATIYAMWRGQLVQRVVDQSLQTYPGVCTGDFATLCNTQTDNCSLAGNPGGICFPAVPDLFGDFASGSAQSMALVRRLLDRYPINGGTGSSLINFFRVPGVPDQNTARDIILLQSLQAGLDLLASDEFAPAFNNSTDQDDYNWGQLHRIVFANMLDDQLSIPPPGSPFNLSPDLRGFSRAGGMGAVDASSHSARADGLDEFMFGSGPARRLIATMTPGCPDVQEVLPGGESGLPGSPQQTDQLFLWLVNANKPLWVCLADVLANATDTETYECGDGVQGPGEQCDDGNTDENDGCNVNCRITPIVSCSSPTVSADDLTCTAAIACSAIASCVDPAGGGTSEVCVPSGPYALGTSDVSVQCNSATEMTVVTCQATVVDTTPPVMTCAADPDELWPPNHRMVDITATTSATDACGGSSTIVLTSVASDEPDNGTGIGDGNTVDDIQGVDAGTLDLSFSLRAERAGSFDGRTYTATYTATDASGNVGSCMALVEVPHDGPDTELSLTDDASGTVATWTLMPEPEPFNVVRGTLSNLTETPDAYHLGDVICIEAGSLDDNTVGNEDAVVPAPGEVFIYVIEYDETGFGTVSADKPRTIGDGGCRQ